jgi:hypothetical protein
MALSTDRFVRCEARADHVDLIVRSPLRPEAPVRMRLLDME